MQKIHEIEIRTSEHYSIALCTCGWIGYPYRRPIDAESDGDQHILGAAGEELKGREIEEWEKQW
jgi:hypothetical protein